MKSEDLECGRGPIKSVSEYVRRASTSPAHWCAIWGVLESSIRFSIVAACLTLCLKNIFQKIFKWFPAMFLHKWADLVKMRMIISVLQYSVDTVERRPSVRVQWFFMQGEACHQEKLNVRFTSMQFWFRIRQELLVRRWCLAWPGNKDSAICYAHSEIWGWANKQITNLGGLALGCIEVNCFFMLEHFF